MDKMQFKKHVILVLLICGCSVTQKQETVSIDNPVAIDKTSHFVLVPLTKFSSIQSPCVDVEIEGKKISMELDLGFRGDISITKENIDLIPSRSFIRERPMYGIRGKQYSTNMYRIPKVKIGKMTLFDPILQEGTQEFIKDSTFVENGGEPSPREPGRLGWELFFKVNLLVDMKNSLIAFCDSLDTLNKHGYAVENFTKTPLFLERGFVEVQAETPEGVLLCMLDTGATLNMLNSEIEEGKSMDQVIWEPDNALEYSSFKIDGNDFGPISFHRIPIKLPIQIDAILGMEFFEENLVFLDFAENYAYFSKNQLLEQ